MSARASMSRSVRTTAVVDTSRSDRPLRSARGVNSATSRRSSGPSGTSSIVGVTTPASSFEMSSSALSSRSINSNAGLDVLDQALGVVRQLGLGQGGQEQPGRVERLEQVVRGRGEEAGLGEVGGIGPRLGLARVPRLAALELGQGLLELGRALADLGLEQGRPLEQRELRALQVHAPLDPADEHVADLAQLRVLALELGEPGVGVVGDHGHGAPADGDAGEGLVDVHRAPLLAEAREAGDVVGGVQAREPVLDLVALGLQPVEHALEADHDLRRADPLPQVLRTGPPCGVSRSCPSDSVSTSPSSIAQ